MPKDYYKILGIKKGFWTKVLFTSPIVILIQLILLACAYYLYDWDSRSSTVESLVALAMLPVMPLYELIDKIFWELGFGVFVLGIFGFIASTIIYSILCVSSAKLFSSWRDARNILMLYIVFIPVVFENLFRFPDWSWLDGLMITFIMPTLIILGPWIDTPIDNKSWFIVLFFTLIILEPVGLYGFVKWIRKRKR